MGATPAIPEPVVELVEDTPPPQATVEFRGQRYPITDAPVPLLSLMKLATYAKRQAAGGEVTPAESMESLAVVYELLASIIDPGVWDQFEEHANRVGAGLDEFQALIGQATEARAGRPTQPPSGSPGGRSTTAPSSAGASSSPGSSIRQGDLGVQQRLEQQGRPDLALVVKRAREASTTS